MHRRKFLLTTASAVTAGMALPLASYQNVLGKNDEIQLGIIGLGSTVKIGGKGKAEIRDFSKIPGVRVAAICDCDSAILEQEVQKFKDRNEPVKAYKDFRDLLDDKDIDAVGITTPNHSHSLITVMACQAGKDVFCQKPASHNIWEGRKMVEAAAKYDRIVQVPHGARETNGIKEALAYARTGDLGDIKYIHGINYKPRTSIGKVTSAQPVSKNIDYNLWAGPGPMDPVMREYFHYDWHWFWEYGNGDLGNMGVHYMEGCRMAAGADYLPERVMSFGGRYGYDDNGETPNTQVIFFDYKPAPVIFEVRGLPSDQYFLQTDWEKGRIISMDTHYTLQIGVLVYCQDGFIANNTAYNYNGKKIREFEPEGENLKENFIKAMRQRDPSIQQAGILDGHYAASLVHMSNISYRLGKDIHPGEIKERVQGEKGLGETYERFMDHLYALRIDTGREPTKMGPMLEFDNKTERFVGDMSHEANQLLKREYRSPFTIEEQV